MRSHAAALIVVLVFSFPLVAGAAETWTCWSEPDDRGTDGSAVPVTRCRLAGETGTTDYGLASDVPVVLSPQVGSGDAGLCWYWTSRHSYWVLIGIADDGAATLGIDPDGVAGGPVLVDASYPRCTAEPAEPATASKEAFELLAQYVHPAPAGVLDPPPGAGVAGMEVFASEAPPAPWSASLVSPLSGLLIEVETFVDAIEISWGDGSETVIPASAFELLTGWPNGGFAHVYETKTCSEPGGPRCHPTLVAYEPEMSYVWVARYRVDGGEWLTIGVPPTAVTVVYDVDEILSVTTAVG